MEFLKKLKGDLNDAGSAIGRKARETAETLRLNNELRNKAKVEEDNLKMLGKIMLRTSYQDCKALCPELVEAIENARKEMQACREALGQLTSEKLCPSCGKPLDPGAAYCVYCGVQVEGRKTRPEYVKCPNCGRTVKTESLFCPYCGAQIIGELESMDGPEEDRWAQEREVYDDGEALYHDDITEETELP